MAIFKFRRRPKVRRGRKPAPLLPELGLSAPERRMNRLIAAVSVLGACATVALAVALTPGAQQPTLRANASQAPLAKEPMAVKETGAPPQQDASRDAQKTDARAQASSASLRKPLAMARIESDTADAGPDAPDPVRVSLPQRAVKADRLLPARWAYRTALYPDPADAEEAASTEAPPQMPERGERQALRGPLDANAGTPGDAVRPAARPDTLNTRLAGTSAEFALAPSRPPAPGETIHGERVNAEATDEPRAGAETIAEEDGNLNAGSKAEAIAEAAAAVLSESGDESETATRGDTADSGEASGARDESAVVAAAETDPVAQAPETQEREVQDSEAEVAATHSAPVTTDVNMRARPDNSSSVILVVPGKRKVEVIDCDYWCEVIYAGKRGYIYKDFVRGANS